MTEQHRAVVYVENGSYTVRHEAAKGGGAFCYVGNGIPCRNREEAETERDAMEAEFAKSGILAKKDSIIHLILSPVKRDMF